MKLTAKLGLGLTLLALPVLLNGCAEKNNFGRQCHPPAVLLLEAPEPKFSGTSNKDLLAWALELRAALRLANSDKKALRQWAAGIETFSPPKAVK